MLGLAYLFQESVKSKELLWFRILQFEAERISISSNEPLYYQHNEWEILIWNNDEHSPQN